MPCGPRRRRPRARPRKRLRPRRPRPIATTRFASSSWATKSVPPERARGAFPVSSSDLLKAPTPRAWLEAAARRRDELLLDHANCEKKAASTALSLMFTYAEDGELVASLSRLAREELRHFEQV